jgi:hypothetical protein
VRDTFILPRNKGELEKWKKEMGGHIVALEFGGSL